MIKRNASDAGEENMNTVIGKSSVITGTIDIKGPLLVEGQIKGKILCSDVVTVGVGGLVEAEIESNTAIIAGKMIGNITATEKIELQAKCELEGDIRTKSLVIEQGAIFCGSCQMKGGKPNLGFLPPDQKQEPKPEQKSSSSVFSFDKAKS
jgi:cytoskeletal protein CcmA (bactofilin family)